MKKKKVDSQEKKTWWVFLDLQNPQSRPDVTLSLLMMLVYGCFSVSDPLKALWNLVQNYDKATSLDWMVKAICGFSLHSFIIFTWFAKSFGGVKTESSILKGTKSSFFHRLLARGIKGHNLMPGGFAPRWFALSIGILLLANKIFLKASMVSGASFNNKKLWAIHKWPGGSGCWANSDMLSDSSIWFARFWRKSPDGCYMVSGGTSNMFYLKPDATVPNLKNPFLDGTDTVDKTRTCMYQCVAWQSLAVQTVLLSSGVIVAGGVFIERLTNAITTKCGYKFIRGNSKEKELATALDTLMKKPSTFLIGWTRTIFVIVLIFFEAFVHAYAVLLDKDGGFTLDYYITSAFMLSVLLALLFRNVETLSRVQPIYTEDLWKNGEQIFQSRESGKKLKVDLYEWSHISSLVKAQLLLDYARTIGLKDLSEFDLNEFVEGQKRQAEPAKELPSVENSESTKLGFRQRLLDVDKRLSLLENGSDDPQQRLTTQDDDEGRVRCIRQHISFTDLFVRDLADGNWVPLRLQVTIEPKATGKVLGQTNHSTAMVLWHNNEFLQCHSDSDKAQKRLTDSPYILTDIKVTHMVEYTDKWHKLQMRIYKAQEEIAAQQALVPV